MRFVRLLFKVAPILLLLSVLLMISVGQCADAIVVTDSTGRPAGTLPVMVRTEPLVPLMTLTNLGEGRYQQSDSTCTVFLAHRKADFRLGNPFVRVDSRFIQLRVAPEVWDGSYWIPAENLEDVFGQALRLSLSGDTLQVTSLVLPAVVPDTSLKRPHAAGEQWSVGTIIVDPGHGGKDPGAPGPPGWHEKTITLDIARRLVSLIEKQGLSAKLTRSGDQFVSLQQRTHFANASHGDLFLSIHCNSNRDKTVHGVEAYFLKPARTQRAVDVAMRENSVVKLEDAGTDYRDLTQENYILLSMATSQNMKDSEAWAVQTTTKTASRTKLNSRGVDQAGFYVLMGAQMPAVLVECGYLSNTTDAKLLISEQGRQAIAEALLNSILEMKKKLETSASR